MVDCKMNHNMYRAITQTRDKSNSNQFRLYPSSKTARPITANYNETIVGNHSPKYLPPVVNSDSSLKFRMHCDLRKLGIVVCVLDSRQGPIAHSAALRHRNRWSFT